MTRAEYIAKYGVAPGVSSAAPVPAPTPVSQTPSYLPTASSTTPIKMTRAEYTAKFGVAPVTPVQAATQEGDGSGGFLKSLVAAPATIVARPFQLGAELIMPGDNTEAIDKFSREKLGGFVAPIPQNTSDVIKDVGRAVQTVALGTGAPIATGAAFGFGSALEQKGSDALTTGGGVVDTLTSTLLGMGAGKALDLVGKPLLNAAGKVIGTITTKTLQDVAAKGVNAVENFMAHHDILPDGAFKDTVAKIPKAAENFDTKVNSLFKGAGDKVTGAIQSQYPGLTKDNVAKHYQKIEVDRLMQPTKTSGPQFKNAREVSVDAERRGIDLPKLMADNKLYASDHIIDKNFATAETVQVLKDEAINGGAAILRPYLREISPSVQRVPMSEVRNEIISKLNDVPESILSPQQKLDFAKKIATEYSDSSVTNARYKNGYSLEDLYNSKLQTSSNLYKTPKGGGKPSLSDNLTNQRKKIESDVFDSLLRKNTPKNGILDDYFKAQEGKFVLANYLESLDGKKATESLFQRAFKKTAQLSGATLGAGAAGPFGMFSGYQFGGIMADTFASASNPVKIAFLKSIGKSEPEIYSIMRQFTTDANIARGMRQTLPEASNVDIGLSKVRNKYGSVEMNPPPAPRSDTFSNNIKQNTLRLFNTPQLPAPSPRIITPNTQGTPNRINTLYGRGGDAGEVGGIRQRRKPRQ